MWQQRVFKQWFISCQQAFRFESMEKFPFIVLELDCFVQPDMLFIGFTSDSLVLEFYTYFKEFMESSRTIQWVLENASQVVQEASDWHNGRRLQQPTPLWHCSSFTRS